MTRYVKSDIQRIFDYLQIVNDDIQKVAQQHTQKDMDNHKAYAEKLLDAKVKVVEAIELLAEANSIKLK